MKGGLGVEMKFGHLKLVWVGMKSSGLAVNSAVKVLLAELCSHGDAGAENHNGKAAALVLHLNHIDLTRPLCARVTLCIGMRS